ncbi:response regulator [Fulvimarina sp. MAC8]|uniref:response regulator transcription factor n=1 Tax=Fulvimarina sp. MAC8 TaxID=3162874 RepID=UPI0032EFF329
MTRLLIVEDEATMAMLTSLMLEDEGYEVVIASNGKKGLEMVRELTPDAIVSDYMMPTMDGLEMVRQLRAEDFEIPVLLLSAIPERRLPVSGEKAYQAYLAKPFLEKDLVDLVAALVRKIGHDAPLQAS